MSGPVKDYVCLDLETSGLYPKYDKIIEIGAVKVKKRSDYRPLPVFG